MSLDSGFRPLHVLTPSRLGGAEVLLARLAPRLRERGHHVHIVCNNRSRSLNALRSLFEESSFEVAARPVGGKVNPRALSSLIRHVKETKSEFTHSHLSSASWWAGWLDALGLCPSIGHVHGFTGTIWHRQQSHLIACSHAVKAHLVESGIKVEKITVLPNPVSPDEFRAARSSEDVRRELGVGTTTPVVGTFGLLAEKKGVRDLIKAVPLVVREHPNVQFWFVGEGPLRAELEQSAALSGCSDNVRFLGFRRDVADVMNAVDIMALPSHREPFGLVYVEAALLDKPSVACTSGGAPEVVLQEKTGLLVPPHDATSLATAINRLLDNRGEATQMGRAGHDYVLETFRWDRFIPTLEEVYGGLREKHRAHR
ncbi:MAG TPA: glycosyltransferase family 4 protein [Abditibacteriaceae bacterium]|nr:glycosyltransferase family 4 protein [Abditibacteriaceae bacterium]